MREAMSGTYNGQPTYCQTMDFTCPYFHRTDLTCPYFHRDGRCHIDDPFEDCDEWGANCEAEDWDEWEDL